MGENPLEEGAKSIGHETEDVSYMIGDEILDLDSTVETILSSMEKDVNHAINSAELSAETGEIVIRIDKKENEDYELLVQSNGSGLTRDAFRTVTNNIGRSYG